MVVIEDHSQTKDEAFDRIMRWVSRTYNSAQTVVQREDRESGNIVINASTTFRRNIVTFPIRYNLTIDVRDDRIRFTSYVGESEAMGVSKGEVQQVNDELAVLRLAIMAAVEEDDDF